MSTPRGRRASTIVGRLGMLATLALGWPWLASAQSVSNAPERWTVSLGSEVVAFTADLAPWRFTSLALGREGDRGSVIAKLTDGARFQRHGVEADIEAYPRLTPRLYLYLDGAHGTSGVFPTWRVAAEGFLSLPQAWEGSLGVRHLRFPATHVTLATGSIAKYAGSYWIALRPYLPVTGAGAAATVMTRRYGRGRDAYVGALLGAGHMPRDEVSTADLRQVRSLQGGVQGSWPLTTRFVVAGQALLTRDAGAASRRQSVDAAGALTYRF